MTTPNEHFIFGWKTHELKVEKLLKAVRPFIFPAYDVARNGQVFIDGDKVLVLRKELEIYMRSTNQ